MRCAALPFRDSTSGHHASGPVPAAPKEKNSESTEEIISRMLRVYGVHSPDALNRKVAVEAWAQQLEAAQSATSRAQCAAPPFPAEVGHWRERALKAEARLAVLEAQEPVSASAPQTLIDLVDAVSHAELVLREIPAYRDLRLFDTFPGLKRAYDRAMAAIDRSSK